MHGKKVGQVLLVTLNGERWPWKATGVNVSILDVIRPGMKPPIFRTRGEYANHYATARRLILIEVWELV